MDSLDALPTFADNTLLRRTRCSFIFNHSSSTISFNLVRTGFHHFLLLYMLSACSYYTLYKTAIQMNGLCCPVYSYWQLTPWVRTHERQYVFSSQQARHGKSISLHRNSMLGQAAAIRNTRNEVPDHLLFPCTDKKKKTRRVKALGSSIISCSQLVCLGLGLFDCKALSMEHTKILSRCWVFFNYKYFCQLHFLFFLFFLFLFFA